MQDFQTTCWSIVLAAGRRPSPDAQRALESLCAAYWHPLYIYARRHVPDVHEAQDLTQAFFVELLAKNYVGSATAERGRFRAFLLTAFKHFLSKQWERAKAKKRGGGKAAISLDFESADSRIRIEPSCRLTSEELYDREWAIALLDRTMERLKQESVAAGRSKHFEELKGFLIGEHAGQTYADIAARLDKSEAALKMTAHRLRGRYRELLRQEIAETVSGPHEVDDEICKLFAVLQL